MKIEYDEKAHSVWTDSNDAPVLDDAFFALGQWMVAGRPVTKAKGREAASRAVKAAPQVSRLE